MTYEAFKTALCRCLKKSLPPGTAMRIQKIRKNNGLELDGLVITNRESNIAPTIFLDDYYEKRSFYPDLEAVCRDLLQTYEQNKSTETIDMDFITNYETVKNQIAFRIINYEKNKELLETVPYERCLDLAVVFYCLLSVGRLTHATILIQTNHQKLWQISTDTLYAHACCMTPQLLPYDLCNMSTLLSDLFEEHQPPDPFCPMYILTNSSKLYGASCMLYPHLLDTIADKLNASLFILPSSIHEVILLPASGCRQSDDLASLVAQINQTELAAEEVLSSHVYYYSKTDQTLRICP